jgi:hypothetical protein
VTSPIIVATRFVGGPLDGVVLDVQSIDGAGAVAVELLVPRVLDYVDGDWIERDEAGQPGRYVLSTATAAELVAVLSPLRGAQLDVRVGAVYLWAED